MTTPIRESIVAALCTSLGAISGVNVYRQRRKEFSKESAPAISVAAGDQQVSEDAPQHTIYEMAVSVVGFVAASTDSAADIAANTLLAQVQSRIGANQTLGGLIQDIREGATTWAADQGHGNSAEIMFELQLSVVYWTRPFDPYTAP